MSWIRGAIRHLSNKISDCDFPFEVECQDQRLEQQSMHNRDGRKPPHSSTEPKVRSASSSDVSEKNTLSPHLEPQIFPDP